MARGPIRSQIPDYRVTACLNHVFGAWYIVEKNNIGLIRKCKHCKAVMTVPEFFARKEKVRNALAKERKHIDLFW